MTENYTDIDILLAKELAGEANADERQVIANWLGASSENQAYYDDLKRLWKAAPQVREGLSWQVDTETALQKVKAKMVQKPQPGLRFQKSALWLRLAAALVVIAAAVWFFRSPAPLPQQDLASNNTTLTDTLTDGSVVVLNRNSGLRIADNFNRKERRMRLSGEAYFQVAHDSLRPFIIEAEALEIQVVGTEFNVQNQRLSGQVQVSVTTGKVLLRCAGQSELLTAGQQAIYDNATKKITRLEKPDPNVLAYKTRVFSFDETPLQTVIEKLNAVYGANISLKNKALGNCPLQTNFNNLELDQILEIIQESFSLTLEKSPSGIVLDGPGCPEK